MNKNFRERPPGNRLSFTITAENWRNVDWKSFEKSWYGRIADFTLLKELGLAMTSQEWEAQGYPKRWEGNCAKCGGHNGDDCHFFGNIVIQKRKEQLEHNTTIPTIFCVSCTLRASRREKLDKKQRASGLLKRCSRCKEPKPVSDFGFRTRKRGLERRSLCRKCEADALRERRKRKGVEPRLARHGSTEANSGSTMARHVARQEVRQDAQNP